MATHSLAADDPRLRFTKYPLLAGLALRPARQPQLHILRFYPRRSSTKDFLESSPTVGHSLPFPPCPPRRPPHDLAVLASPAWRPSRIPLMKRRRLQKRRRWIGCEGHLRITERASVGPVLTMDDQGLVLGTRERDGVSAEQRRGQT